MNTTLVSFSEKEIEKWVSDFVYLLWFKSCSAKTSKFAHPVQGWQISEVSGYISGSTHRRDLR